MTKKSCEGRPNVVGFIPRPGVETMPRAPLPRRIGQRFGRPVRVKITYTSGCLIVVVIGRHMCFLNVRARKMACVGAVLSVT
jgi:hypothetical protein